MEINRGNAARAIEILQVAQPYEGGDPGTKYIRGVAYLKAGRTTDALQEFQKALAFKNTRPGSPYIFMALLGDWPRPRHSW